ncbi:hypothetical protein IAR55_000774 [Kwoniella newhampshirensis]|uniref:Aminoglycoside phosphotransferase domain-containing protein n=1 Tax=Kwoniella newhampshirensis TaxID=1651941 RepID=A0AAW0Z3U7_9TREE
MRYMLRSTCGFEGCSETVLGPLASCELDRTIRGLDQKTLAQQAQALRPGHSCHIVLPPNYVAIKSVKGRKMYSGTNIHFPIEFDDGIKWVARARLANAYRPPPDMRRMITESEVATMEVLKQGDVLVPKAWMPPLLDNELLFQRNPGSDVTDYFFVEFIQGSPLIKGHATLTGGKIATDVVRTFITDLAQHHQALSRIRLNVKGIGSLMPGQDPNGTPVLGPLVQGSLMMTPEPPYFCGPFMTNKERYLVHVDLALKYIHQQCILLRYPVATFLAYLEMRELIEENEEMGREETEFFIKHADDKNDQYMLRDDGHLVGVLDWEWAYTTTKTEAFCAPMGLFWSSEWAAGDNALTPEEQLLIDIHEAKGRPDLADCVRNGRVYQRLLDNMRDDDLFGPDLHRINALRDAFLGDKAGKPFGTIEEWKEYNMSKYGDDPRIADIELWVKKRSERRGAEMERIRVGEGPPMTKASYTNSEAPPKGPPRDKDGKVLPRPKEPSNYTASVPEPQAKMEDADIRAPESHPIDTAKGKGMCHIIGHIARLEVMRSCRKEAGE